MPAGHGPRPAHDGRRYSARSSCGTRGGPSAAGAARGTAPGRGAYKLDGALLLVLDVDRVLDIEGVVAV